MKKEIERNHAEDVVNRSIKEAVIQDDRFEIPMDSPLEEFKYHLKSHPRTILSAKFGDGKSFFLSKFEKEKKDDYLIITLHPVNYQVVENKDIFELIKRDVLFQITINEMLDENLEISEEAAWAFYIQNNFMGLSENVVSFLSLLQSTPETVSGVLAALKTHKIYNDLRKKVMELKKNYSSNDALETFFDKCEKTSVLEDDLVTKIIQDSIDCYKKANPQKRVVLVIEDMDRLDPAHLFRILNVFSAHLDTNEKYFVKSNETYFYNKFHFDNVVFVMDFDNTRNIFKHFYGTDTNFEGYIEKFVTKGIFRYSLKVVKYLYFIDRVTSITGLPKVYVKAVLKLECFEGKTIRAIVNSFENVRNHIIRYPIYDNKRLHFGILELYAIMKNLGVDGTELVKNIFTANRVNVLQYIIGVLCMEWRWPNQYKDLNSKYIVCQSINKNNTNPYNIIVINGYNDDNNCLDYMVIPVSTLSGVCDSLWGGFIKVSPKEMSPTLLNHVILRHSIENLPEILDKFVA